MNAKRELWLLVACLMLGSAAFAETKVEVTLVDRLDEPRGFCFDTLGFQAQARPEEGLQAHSCYSYQGQLAVDQAFDGDLIPEGTFKLIEFDLCMTLTGAGTGSTFALEPCDGGDLQRFEHRANGKVTAVAAPGNCVTAGERAVSTSVRQPVSEFTEAPPRARSGKGPGRREAVAVCL